MLAGGKILWIIWTGSQGSEHGSMVGYIYQLIIKEITFHLYMSPIVSKPTLSQPLQLVLCYPGMTSSSDP